MPPAAEYFIGTVAGELVCHVAVAPMFQNGAYRAMRLVVMPEWQGAGIGTKFLEATCEHHKNGHGRCARLYPTLFHTSHPQLIAYLSASPRWVLKSQQLYGVDKKKSMSSINKAQSKNGASPVLASAGYGGHFRCVQGFKYIGTPSTPTPN